MLSRSEAAYYDVSDTLLDGTGIYILIYSPTTEKVMLVKSSSNLNTIKATGGAGGQGADGQDNDASKENPVVSGDNGKRGGDGGDGGRINFRYPENYANGGQGDYRKRYQ